MSKPCLAWVGKVFQLNEFTAQVKNKQNVTAFMLNNIEILYTPVVILNKKRSQKMSCSRETEINTKQAVVVLLCFFNFFCSDLRSTPLIRPPTGHINLAVLTRKSQISKKN